MTNRATLKRISNDTYDTRTRKGYNIVQEDWIAGQIDSIRYACQAVTKELSKNWMDKGYIQEKIDSIIDNIEATEFRLDLILRPPIPFDSNGNEIDPNKHVHNHYCNSPCNE